MKTFKQVMGALSRDMLFLHGHIVSIQGLDGAAQRSTYPTPREATRGKSAGKDAPRATAPCKNCHA